MLGIIKYEDIKKYKRYFTSDLNNNSKLYFDKDVIHKIPDYINKNFKNILEKIDKLNLNELIELKNIIESKNILVGYSFKNYKEHKILKKLSKRNFQLKKQDCFKIIKSYNLLSSNNLKYSDFHRGNVLINEYTNNIKICDLDGISIIEDKELINNQQKNAIILCLAYLYNINYYDIRNVIDAKGVNNSNNQINKFSKNIYDLKEEDVIELISKLDEELFNIEKKEIISTSKELCKTGYYLYRRF